jgi:DNA ligase D-like protein (predicted ligase)
MTALDGLGETARERLRPAAHPRWCEPTLATRHDEPFRDAGWLFERKLDGERCLAFRDGDRVRLRSRNRKPLEAAYPEIVDAAHGQLPEDAVVDGEIVAFDGPRTSFARLQPRMQVADADEARRTGVAVFYYLFDLLHLDGHDCTGLALRARKRLLRDAVAFADPLRLATHRNHDGEGFYAEACARGWEGLIAKRADATYPGSRTRDWLKLTCTRAQELVVGGFTEPQGRRTGFGALLVGYHDDGRLVYAGKVGTGYDEDTLSRLRAQLNRRQRAQPPFDAGDLPRRGVGWVAPELVVEVSFTEWTRDGRLRHPRYQGVRRDKDPAEVVKEHP